jgi:hypothetical protein
VSRPPFDAKAARARCEAATREALPHLSRYAPCPHNATVAAGFNWLKCEDCGRTVPKEHKAAEAEAAFEDAYASALLALADLLPALDTIEARDATIEALHEDLADARTSALEEAARIADGYCGDGVALDQWTPRGDGERTREDIAREIRAAISAPRVDPRDAEIEALKARLTAILDMLDAEEHDLAQHLAEKARALA